MNGLVLAGGHSSRMESDKALLEFEGFPLYERALRALAVVSGETFVSARPNSDFISRLEARVLFDDLQNIGPAAALLRAHREARLDDWLVLACDFPFVTETAVHELIAKHEANEAAELTCYAHADGTPEPLFAIWTPIALARLASNVKTGILGPMATLRQCETQLVRPRESRLLINTNTPHEWSEALK